MGKLGMIQVLFRENTIVMVLLAITYVAVEINTTEALNVVSNTKRSGRLASDEDEDIGSTFNYNIHNTLLHI